MHKIHYVEYKGSTYIGLGARKKLQKLFKDFDLPSIKITLENLQTLATKIEKAEGTLRVAVTSVPKKDKDKLIKKQKKLKLLIGTGLSDGSLRPKIKLIRDPLEFSCDGRVVEFEVEVPGAVVAAPVTVAQERGPLPNLTEFLRTENERVAQQQQAANREMQLQAGPFQTMRGANWMIGAGGGLGRAEEIGWFGERPDEIQPEPPLPIDMENLQRMANAAPRPRAVAPPRRAPQPVDPRPRRRR